MQPKNYMVYVDFYELILAWASRPAPVPLYLLWVALRR